MEAGKQLPQALTMVEFCIRYVPMENHNGKYGSDPICDLVVACLLRRSEWSLTLLVRVPSRYSTRLEATLHLQST